MRAIERVDRLAAANGARRRQMRSGFRPEALEHRTRRNDLGRRASGARSFREGLERRIARNVRNDLPPEIADAVDGARGVARNRERLAAACGIPLRISQYT